MAFGSLEPRHAMLARVHLQTAAYAYADAQKAVELGNCSRALNQLGHGDLNYGLAHAHAFSGDRQSSVVGHRWLEAVDRAGKEARYALEKACLASKARRRWR